MTVTALIISGTPDTNVEPEDADDAQSGRTPALVFALGNGKYMVTEGDGTSAAEKIITGLSTGAALIGIADSANKITGTNVETALAEIALYKYDLGLTTNAKGASLIGIEDAALQFTAATVEAALAEVKVLADAGMPVLKKTLTVAHGDLTDAVNGEAQAINLDTALPANARIVGVALKLATPFTGGGAASVALDIGTAGDADAIVDGADVLAAAVDGQASTQPSGIAPNKHFAAGGQLLATFTPDGGAALLGLTAGSLVIDVLYTVLA